MAAPFGFSVGDFIGALNLVSDVIDALRESGQASTEYRELLRQLYSLETALIQVKRLSLEQAQQSELAALKHAAVSCQETINAFGNKTRSYEPYRWCQEASSLGIRGRWKKIKWSLFRKNDVDKFKADLAGHTVAIQLLLSTVQIQHLACNDKEPNQSSNALVKQNRDWTFNIAKQLTSISQGISQIFRTTIRTFEVVLQIQEFLN